MQVPSRKLRHSPKLKTPSGALSSGISEEDVESFNALNVEVLIRSPTLGEVWLVPELTDASRRELSISTLRKMLMVDTMFPGSRVYGVSEQHKGTADG